MTYIPEFLAVLTALILLMALAVTLYCKWVYSYWEKRNIPSLETTILLGNAQNPVARKMPPFMYLKGIYDMFRRQNAKHCGIFIFTSPMYIPMDLEYIKNILTKDFQHFVDRGVYYNEKDDPLSVHLVSIEGQKWKNMRAKLTPTFTSGKMKMMFPTLLESGNQMLQAMERLRSDPIDIKEVLGCFTTDVIGSCAFGIDCNSFKEKDSQFRLYGCKAFAGSLSNTFRMLFCMSFPNLARRLHARILNPEATDFFLDVVKRTVDYREKNNVLRNDFIQILLELKNGKSADGEILNGLTTEEIAAQAFIFFLAGFETSSTTMMFCLFELAQNQEVQNKVRNEINRVIESHDGKITYEAILELKYMGQVIDETLRMYPAIPMLNRMCTKEYKLPDGGSVLEKGTRVLVPIYALQHDPKYYPHPEKFDPDRFTDESKATRHPFAYLPFGEGPRVCIGMRFGIMQTRVGLLLLIKNYQFTLNSKTTVPLQFDRNSFMLGLKETIWLNAESLA